jgi:hypothetical protein
MKNFSSWLKEKHNLRGGGSKNILQGGGAQIEANLNDSIKEWVLKNQ